MRITDFKYTDDEKSPGYTISLMTGDDARPTLYSVSSVEALENILNVEGRTAFKAGKPCDTVQGMLFNKLYIQTLPDIKLWERFLKYIDDDTAFCC